MRENLPRDVGGPWQRNGNLNVASREAEFIPRLDHACQAVNMLSCRDRRRLTRFEVHVMISFLIKAA